MSNKNEILQTSTHSLPQGKKTGLDESWGNLLKTYAKSLTCNELFFKNHHLENNKKEAELKECYRSKINFLYFILTNLLKIIIQKKNTTL